MAENDNRPRDDLAVNFEIEDGIPNSDDPFGDFPSDFSTDIKPGELVGQKPPPASTDAPMPAEISQRLMSMLVQNLAAVSPEAQAVILEMAKNAKLGSLGSIGASLLVVTTVMALRHLLQN